MARLRRRIASDHTRLMAHRGDEHVAAAVPEVQRGVGPCPRLHPVPLERGDDLRKIVGVEHQQRAVVLGRAGHQPQARVRLAGKADVQVPQALVIGVVEHLEAEHVAVERERLVLIGDADHHSPDRPEHARKLHHRDVVLAGPGPDVAAFQRRRQHLRELVGRAREDRARRARRTRSACVWS